MKKIMVLMGALVAFSNQQSIAMLLTRSVPPQLAKTITMRPISCLAQHLGSSKKVGLGRLIAGVGTGLTVGNLAGFDIGSDFTEIIFDVPVYDDLTKWGGITGAAAGNISLSKFIGGPKAAGISGVVTVAAFIAFNEFDKKRSLL